MKNGCAAEQQRVCSYILYMCIILCARCKTEESYKKDEIAAKTGGRSEEKIRARHAISFAMIRDFK